MSERRFCGIPGGVCSVGEHCVRCPKYRRQILGGCVADRCGLLLAQVAVEHGGEIVTQRVTGDHVHLLVRVGPTDASAQVLRAFIRRTAWVLQQEFAYLRRLTTVSWSPLCVAAPVGEVSEWPARRSIEHQWDEVA